jgi:hypothetical protein
MHNTRHNVRITLDGETKILVDWSSKTGLSPDIIRYRIRAGWDLRQALETPAVIGNNQLLRAECK